MLTVAYGVTAHLSDETQPQVTQGSGWGWKNSLSPLGTWKGA